MSQLDSHLARLTDGEREEVARSRRFNCFLRLLTGAVHRCVTCVSSRASLLILLSKLLLEVLRSIIVQVRRMTSLFVHLLPRG